jgi:hypothetical protein
MSVLAIYKVGFFAAITGTFFYSLLGSDYGSSSLLARYPNPAPMATPKSPARPEVATFFSFLRDIFLFKVKNYDNYLLSFYAFDMITGRCILILFICQKLNTKIPSNQSCVV